MQKIVVILGPTGTGKTSLAIQLCQKFDGEIISADSRQVYQGADLGTNKVTGSKIQDTGYRGRKFWMKEGVKIHFYDATTPDRPYSAGQFIDQAERVVTNLWKKRKLPFVVGGTGFYISALLGEIKLSGVSANPQLRSELGKSSLTNLQASLKTLNPGKFKRMHPSERKNKHRLIRAIEIATALKLNKQTARPKTTQLKPAQTLKIGLTAPRGFLYEKADQWIRSMVEHGLIDETRKLIEKGYKNTPLMQGIIYKQSVDFVEGKFNQEEMIKRIQSELHGYIRRQLTWFKRDQKIKWYDLSQPDFDKRITELVRLFLDDRSSRNN